MLNQNNRYTYLRRELSGRLLRMYDQGALLQDIDGLPVTMIPRNQRSLRCCIHRDRALIRSRILTLLGVNLEDDDEIRSLSSYAAEALHTLQTPGEPILTMISEACSACTSSHYRVSENCRGCLARPCMENCPRQAVSMQQGRAVIDKERCVSCGKCQELCPFKAIQYIPVPCEEACPVGAISKDEQGRAAIDNDTCISCGRCTRACPFGAVVERSQILQAARLLKGSEHVTALLAPSFIGQFPGTPEQICEAVRALGFDEVREVAEGAAATAEEEAREVMERKSQGASFTTTSCCPAYTEAVKKHLPGLRPHISKTPSPMEQLACRVSEDRPETVQIFIGPCIAKRKEAMNSSHVDYVLTFEELGMFFAAWNVSVESMPADKQAEKTVSAETAPESGNAECSKPERDYGKIREFDAGKSESAAEKAALKAVLKADLHSGRKFAEAGGVAAAVGSCWKGEEQLQYSRFDGLDKRTMKRLKVLDRIVPPETDLVEVMACSGGCVHGPGIITSGKTM